MLRLRWRAGMMGALLLVVLGAAGCHDDDCYVRESYYAGPPGYYYAGPGYRADHHGRSFRYRRDHDDDDRHRHRRSHRRHHDDD